MSILYDRASELVRSFYDYRMSSPSVLDITSCFPDAERLSQDWQSIRDEALCVAREIQKVPLFHELMEEQADISAQDGRDWRMFVLQAYGVPVKRNMDQCPVLSSLIASSPDVLSAALSFLAPGKHIPQHRGPFRGILRFYLGLSVPMKEDGSPAVVLMLDSVEHRIGNGEFLLWDDTYPHEVWNQSDELRIALLMDIRRRDMPPDLKFLSNLIVRLIGTTICLRRIF